MRAGRAITAALSPGAVYEEVRQAALEVLRASSCTVTAQAAAPAESLLSAGGTEARAPIAVRGKAVAWIAAQSGARGGFGDDDRQLLGFIAALAGAALENAEGFERAQTAVHLLVTSPDFVTER